MSCLDVGLDLKVLERRPLCLKKKSAIANRPAARTFDDPTSRPSQTTNNTERPYCMECQYVATQRGGIALLFEGHRYNKVRDGKEGTVYWRCARDRQCPGRAVTVFSRIKKANNKHNHPPDTWRNRVDQAVSDLKLQGQDDDEEEEEELPGGLSAIEGAPGGGLPAFFSETIKSRNRTLNPGGLSLPYGGGDFRPNDRWLQLQSDSTGPSTSEPLDMALRAGTSSSGMLLKRLRALMRTCSYVNEALQAYIVPSGDAHQSEYLAPCDQRRAYLTGFTGSSGTAVVTEDQAALWTDGRYFIEAERQLDHNWHIMKDGLPGTLTQGEWLSKVLPSGSRVGVDPMMISYEMWKPMSEQLEQSGHILVGVGTNLIDLIWDDRPAPPNRPLEPLPVVYTGKPWQEKILEVRREMQLKEAQALVITALDEVAWLFNLRGSDINYNPVFFSYAVVTMDNVYLFLDEAKATPSVQRHLQDASSVSSACAHASPPVLSVQLHPYHQIREFLECLVRQLNGRIWISNQSSYGLVSLVPQHRRIDSSTPVMLKKAIKNDVEIECMRHAHIKDAVALCDFFAWLEESVPRGQVTEMSAVAKLDEMRRQQEDYVGPSFETISASGPNGAIIHYRPTKETDRPITTTELYLCDSGAQFRDGTTDVTRTWHFGAPTQYEKECFTRVLKGHIAVSSAVFPKLVKGQMLDTLARKALWDVGLDYLHGTGHGVGVYLNVHEGPTGINWRTYPDDPGIQEGMILSDEPGYYEEGHFGIRVENLVLVKKAETKYNFKDRGYLTFEPLTLVPIQRKLLVPSMMTAQELRWLDNYHQMCRDIVGKALEDQGRHGALQWLLRETQPLG